MSLYSAKKGEKPEGEEVADAEPVDATVNGATS